MKCKYLNSEEKNDSKKLYREVFTEDSADFIKYYYENIGKRNKILVIRDEKDANGKVTNEKMANENAIIGMLHQNPHYFRVGNIVKRTEYIYGVAVRQEYRHKGYMSKMMGHALKNMYDSGIDFTYLFPVQKGLYESFGFGYAYGSPMVCSGTIKEYGMKGQLLEYTDEKIDKGEVEGFIRDFFENQEGIYLSQSQTYLDEWLALEAMNDEDGRIYIYKEKGRIKAVLKVIDQCVVEEIGTKVCIEKAFYLWKKNVEHGEQEESLCVAECGDGQEEHHSKVNSRIEQKEELPAMVRILHLADMTKYICFPKELDITTYIKDDMFQSNEGAYRISGGKMRAFQGECQQQMNIRQFTEWLFTMIPFQIKDQI